MNEETMNNVTTVETTQETIPAETEQATVGSVFKGLLCVAGTCFLAGFSAMAGLGIGKDLFCDEEKKKERKANKAARKANRKLKKALKKAKKHPVTDVQADDVNVETEPVEE